MSDNIDPLTGLPRRPTHELAKWRTHSYQQQPAAITLDDQIDEVRRLISLSEKAERAYRQAGHTGLADKQSMKLGNLQVQLEELLKQKKNAPVNIDQEVDRE